jgi:hypothetical protein
MAEPELLHVPRDETAPEVAGTGDATTGRVELSGDEAMALLSAGRAATIARVGRLKFVVAVPFAV